MCKPVMSSVTNHFMNLTLKSVLHDANIRNNIPKSIQLTCWDFPILLIYFGARYH